MIQLGKKPAGFRVALLIGIVIVFFTQPLQFIPVSALGIVLMYASWSLIDLRGLWNLRRRNKQAFRLAFFTFGCVLIIGVIQGIGLRCCWACYSSCVRSFVPLSTYWELTKME
jgi:MFS superfamily sulfate permease-like transporter